MKAFGTIFLSIILEGFPFILLGTFISSCIQVFLSKETLQKFIPRNKFLGIFISSFIGLVFPVCECAIIPVTKGLVKKGLPTSMAITFMLSVPILNPICIASTYYAFLDKPYMVYGRIICGLICAISIGILMESLYKGDILKEESKASPYRQNIKRVNNGKKLCKDNGVVRAQKHKKSKENSNAILKIIHHVNIEFYEVGKLFTIGALISSALQTFVPQQYLINIGKGNLSSIIAMMLLAFVLSICSETDAFIAKSFIINFTPGSIMGFLILGPMLDIKNAILLLGNFKKKFVFILMFLIVTMCFICSCIFNVGFYSLIN